MGCQTRSDPESSDLSVNCYCVL